jgi:hypothetical protein
LNFGQPAGTDCIVVTFTGRVVGDHVACYFRAMLSGVEMGPTTTTRINSVNNAIGGAEMAMLTWAVNRTVPAPTQDTVQIQVAMSDSDGTCNVSDWTLTVQRKD